MDNDIEKSSQNIEEGKISMDIGNSNIKDKKTVILIVKVLIAVSAIIFIILNINQAIYLLNPEPIKSSMNDFKPSDELLGKKVILSGLKLDIGKHIYGIRDVKESLLYKEIYMYELITGENDPGLKVLDSLKDIIGRPLTDVINSIEWYVNYIDTLIQKMDEQIYEIINNSKKNFKNFLVSAERINGSIYLSEAEIPRVNLPYGHFSSSELYDSLNSYEIELKRYLEPKKIELIGVIEKTPFAAGGYYNKNFGYYPEYQISLEKKLDNTPLVITIFLLIVLIIDLIMIYKDILFVKK